MCVCFDLIEENIYSSWLTLLIFRSELYIGEADFVFTFYREELAGVHGPADREGEEEEEESLITINNNLHLPQLSKVEPPPLTLQPLPRNVTMKYTGIASSPYKVGHGSIKRYFP